MKFSENPSIEMRDFPHEWIEELAHMEKLKVAFSGFVYANNYEVIKYMELAEWKM